MQECACIIQSNGLGRQAAKGARQHAGTERFKSRQQRVKELGLGGQVGCGVG
jgi:hypothetical protein